MSQRVDIKMAVDAIDRDGKESGARVWNIQGAKCPVTLNSNLVMSCTSWDSHLIPSYRVVAFTVLLVITDITKSTVKATLHTVLQKITLTRTLMFTLIMQSHLYRCDPNSYESQLVQLCPSTSTSRHLHNFIIFSALCSTWFSSDSVVNTNLTNRSFWLVSLESTNLIHSAAFILIAALNVFIFTSIYLLPFIENVHARYDTTLRHFYV